MTIPDKMTLSMPRRPAGIGLLLPAVITLILISLLPAGQALAENGVNRKYGVNIGLFLTTRDTKTIFRASGGGDSDVDMEDDLGLDPDDNVFRLDAFYRIGTRHRLDFSYYDLSRENNRVIDIEFEWKDTIYEIDTEVSSDFELVIYKASYTYEFLQNERGALGVSAGFHVTDLGVSIFTVETGEGELGDVTAPLPVFGLRGEYALTDRWTLRGSAELFVFEVENIDGTMYDAYAAIDYHFTDNFALGVALNGVGLDVDATRRNLESSLEWDYSGWLAYMRFDF